jgi:hypothetical protein
MYHRLKERYPPLDLIESAKDWREYKADTPLKPKDNPRSQFNTSCKNYIKWGKNLKKTEVRRQIVISPEVQAKYSNPPRKVESHDRDPPKH